MGDACPVGDAETVEAALNTIVVGFNGRNYPEQRNILAYPPRGVTVRRTSNAFRALNYALFRAFRYTDPLLFNLHLGRPDCDVRHLFNGVSANATPWVSTFETAIPRWNGAWPIASRFGLRLMAGEPCKRIIAMSNCTAGLQREFMCGFPDLAPAIEQKMVVLHPPQAVLSQEAARLRSGDTIELLFVGRAFFRKGGLAILRAFERVIAEGVAARLTVVSALEYGDHTGSTKDDWASAMATIARQPAITHHLGLPNAKVLELMRSAHVFLNPSLAETYGYAVLEAQASGLPVITTDVRAFPEINGDAMGWLIPVNKTATGNGIIATASQRAEMLKRIEDGIVQALRAVANDPAIVHRKGSAAISRIRNEHDPDRYASRLLAIYRDAVRK